MPLVFATWFFGWKISIFCLIGILLGSAIHAIFISDISFWFSIGLISGLVGVVIIMVVGVVRWLIQTVLKMQVLLQQAEQNYQRVSELNTLRDQTLQTVSHQMRTMLTQIQGYLELATDYKMDFDAETINSFLEQSKEGSQELLRFSKLLLEAPRKVTPELKVFSLRQEIEAVMKQCQECGQNQKIQLVYPEPSLVRADPLFVRQVLRNLLENALKYANVEAPVTIRVSTKQHEGQVCIQVSDQGPGISSEHVPHLFQRFVRLPDARAGAQPGTGLGLAICKQLVEAMGGQIWLDRTKEQGEGACFAFTLKQARNEDILSVAERQKLISVYNYRVSAAPVAVPS